MTSFHETAILVYSWPVLPLTLLWCYLWDAIMFFTVLSIVGHKKKKQLFIGSYTSVFIVSLGVNALCAAVLWLSSALVRSQNSVLLTKTVLVILVVCSGIIKYNIYQRIVFVRHHFDSIQSRKKVAVFLACLTAPWLFLVPAEYAYDWLGTILITLGAPFSQMDAEVGQCLYDKTVMKAG